MDNSENIFQAEGSPPDRIPPRDRFAADVVQFDLHATAAQLDGSVGGDRSGHRQIALYKHERSTIALFRFEQGGRMPAHEANGLVIIQVIEGKLALDVVGVEHTLEVDGVLVLAPGVEHDVVALEPTLMLLTVCLDAPSAL